MLLNFVYKIEEIVGLFFLTKREEVFYLDNFNKHFLYQVLNQNLLKQIFFDKIYEWTCLHFLIHTIPKMLNTSIENGCLQPLIMIKLNSM